MPTSRSPKPSANTRTPRRSRLVAPLLVLVVLAVLAVVAAALPASLAARALPASIQAADFSGTLWHGSAGSLRVAGREAGAVEWHVHPVPLLRLAVAAEVHWVKGGFVADGNVDAARNAIVANDVHGSGPIEDLQTLGVAAGWRGTCTFDLKEIKLAIANGSAIPESVVGDVNVTDLAAPHIANGANLGDYHLHAANGAITPDADATAELNDTGGPLELRAFLHYSAKDHTGQLSGTIKERVDISPALRKEIDTLTQLHARDAEGRIPVDMEVSF